MTAHREDDDKGFDMTSKRRLGIGLLILILIFAGIGAATWFNRTQRSENGLITEVETNEQPVQVIIVKPTDLTETIETTGTLRANRDVVITSEVAGKVQKSYKELGEYCKKGELLFRLDNEGFRIALAQVNAQFNQAEVALHYGKIDLERLQRLKNESAIAPQQLDSMEASTRLKAANLEQVSAALDAAKRNLRETKITCPFAGYVASRMADQGQMVNPSTPLARLMNIDPLKLSLSVDSRVLSQLQVGQRVTLADPNLPAQKIVGQVSRLGISAAESSRTFPVEVTVEQQTQKLRAGQLVRATLHLKDYQQVLAVPIDAIQYQEDNTSVFVVRKGKAHLQEVTIGATIGESLIVESGLSTGEKVIVLGSEGLRDGKKVLIVNSSQHAQEPSLPIKDKTASHASTEKQDL